MHDHPRRGRRFFHFGDEAQAIGIAGQMAGEGTEIVPSTSGGLQFSCAGQEFFDFETFLGDDFVQAVHTTAGMETVSRHQTEEGRGVLRKRRRRGI